MRLIAAIIVTACGVMTAHATQPSSVVWSADYSWSIACDGYSLTAAHSTEVRETAFFNNDGTVKTIRYQLKGTVEVFRDGFPHNALSGIRRDMQQFDPSSSIFEVSGGNIRVVLPGYGPILLEAGRFIVDASTREYLFFAGMHQNTKEEFDAVCEYFR